MASAPIDPKQLSLLWAGPDRAADIAKMHLALFDPPWGEAAIHTLLDHPAATALVALATPPGGTATTHKVPVAFVIGQLAADEAEILSIGVAADWQRRGIGRRLIEGLARAVKRAEARAVFLEVAEDNAAALALYRGLGFKETGRRKGYYERPGAKAVDALRLTLEL